jgi:hypothetical protein
VVFTLPWQVADIAYQNKATAYGLLFQALAQTLLIIAADPRHLGAKSAMTSILHTWGSALTHHLLPGSGLLANHERGHVHMIVPGGGLSKKRQLMVRPVLLLRRE